MPATDNAPAYEVQLDLYIARRKRMHSIFDPSGIPVYHAPHIIQVLDWLADKDLTTARFTDETATYNVEFHRTAPDTPNTGE